MKTISMLLMLLTSLQLFGQVEVNKDVIDLGVITETNGTSVKKVVLKVSPRSPESFKIKFTYKYKFVSQELGDVYVAPNGSLGFTTRDSMPERFEGESKILVDISDSTAMSRSDDLELVLSISKPNQNSHGIKVEMALKDAKGNVVSGGRKLLGLLGRSFKVEASSCEK